MLRAQIISIMTLAVLFSVMMPTASAICGTEFTSFFSISTINNDTSMFLVNGSVGFETTAGNGKQLVWCNATTTSLCYNNTYIRCYKGNTAMPTIIDEGNGSDSLFSEESLLLWDTMNSTTGNDKSIYHHAGTTENTPIIDVGKIGKGILMTEEAGDPCVNPDSIAYGDINTLDGLTSMSWGGWEKPVWDGVSSINYGDFTIVSKTYEDDGSGWQLVQRSGVGGDSRAYCWTHNGGVGNYLYTTDNVLTTTNNKDLKHIFCTYDGTNLKIYVNGVLNNTGAVSGAITANTRNVRIGGIDKIYNYRGFNGTLDDIRVYNRTLSANEIYAIYATAQNYYSTIWENKTITITTNTQPNTVYSNNNINLSIFYNSTKSLNAVILINISKNNINITTIKKTFSPEETTTIVIGEGNFTKGDIITYTINATDTEQNENIYTDSILIHNSPPILVNFSFYPHSIIPGDSFNATATATDIDGDSITTQYLYGFNNGTNITGWVTSGLINTTFNTENLTYRVYIRQSDGSDNTTTIKDINMTRILIMSPTGEQYTLYPSLIFNITTQEYQPCYEYIDSIAYNLGNISSGMRNGTIYTYYGNHTYTVVCFSLKNTTLNLTKTVNFSSVFANWTIRLYTENEWTTPIIPPGANLSVVINCEGGSIYVYNFTGSSIAGVKPVCVVSTIAVKVDYTTDSYVRERTPPICSSCDVEFYIIDALSYTLLQIPVFMMNYKYYNSKMKIYKTSGSNQYVITEGYFDLEHKYIAYLTKDNSYLISIKTGTINREIGFLYAVTATSQQLDLSEIRLVPDITLISDNILMGAEFDNPSANYSTLRISYEDLLNATESVRIRIYSGTNNTAFYDNTFTSSNFTIAINNVSTTRKSVSFSVEHSILGNSPIPYVIGLGASMIPFFNASTEASEISWIFAGIAFCLMLFTSFAITPDSRLPGYIVLILEFTIFASAGWLTDINGAEYMLLLAFLVSGIIYEIRYRSVQ